MRHNMQFLYRLPQWRHNGAHLDVVCQIACIYDPTNFTGRHISIRPNEMHTKDCLLWSSLTVHTLLTRSERLQRQSGQQHLKPEHLDTQSEDREWTCIWTTRSERGSRIQYARFWVNTGKESKKPCVQRQLLGKTSCQINIRNAGYLQLQLFCCMLAGGSLRMRQIVRHVNPWDFSYWRVKEMTMSSGG